MAAGDFVYTNPEAARQAIAQIQERAAAAENASRERIAREATAQQRYVTQSQIAERDKDREVTRENYALHRDIVLANQKLDTDRTRDVAAKERARLQFGTIIEKLNNNIMDPPTQRELEKLFAAGPDLTEDQKSAARSVREDIFKAANANSINSARAAKNYTIEFDAFKKAKIPDATGLERLYKRLDGDKDVIFDRSSNTVQPKYLPPREDSAEPTDSVGSVSNGGAPGRSQVIGGTPNAGTPSYAPATGGAFPTIADMQERMTGASRAAPGAPSAQTGPTRSMAGGTIFQDRGAAWSDTPTSLPLPPLRQPGPVGVIPEGPVRVSDIGSPVVVPQESPGFAPRSTDFAVPRTTDFYAPPEPLGYMGSDFKPGSAPRRMSNIDAVPPRFIDMSDPRRPAAGEMLGPQNSSRKFNSLPFANPPPQRRDIGDLLRFAQHPNFKLLAPHQRQAVIDEINAAESIPRASDIQGLRPEYIPTDPGYQPLQ
jgi:hypothetical protein